MSRPLIAFAALISCTAAAQNPVQLELHTWATGLAFPVDVTHAGDSRLFVVSQPGVIHVVTDSNTVLPDAFLDITDKVNYGGESGLLGLAFDPDFQINGAFYVSYIADTGNGISTISRFHVSTDPNIADTTEEVLFTWPQPGDIHKGGDLDFGPDGYLYIGLGDGAGGGDPFNTAQDLSDPLGDILRIDVSDPDTTYTIPPDNPFVNAGPDTLKEIWASGFRNPYRFGFDRMNGEVWIGDVGENDREEVNFWPAGDHTGPNFGWRCYEANAVFDTSGCPPAASLVFPVTWHAHATLGGTFCAVIGGRVYRGAAYPHLAGRYIYGDLCSGEFWTLHPDGLGGWTNELVLTSGLNGLTCIGDAANNELFATNLATSTLYHVVDRCPMDPPAISFTGDSLTSTPATLYQWYLDSNAIAGAYGQSYLPVQNGSYTVLATFDNGCALFSDPVEVLTTGMHAPAPTALFNVWPQPAMDELIVARNVPVSRDQHVLVSDAHGRAMYRTIWPAGATQLRLDVRAWADGLYLITIHDADGTTLGRLRMTRSGR